MEMLEGRLLLYAANGGEWARPERVTFSFVPDGTDIGGSPSTLNVSMAWRGISSGAWRDAFREAASVWGQLAGIELAEVPDSGIPYAASGDQQGDSRVGDIRIGGVSLGYGSLGVAFTPPPINGGTVAGDIVLNTSAPWSLYGDYNLETVAIHEIGHALGLSHSAISQAVMYTRYTGIKTTLHTDDAEGIRAIYGPRSPDGYEGSGNQSYSTATNITGKLDPSGRAQLSGLNIHVNSNGSADQDWYYVVAPPSTNGTLTVAMQSSDLSLLSPRVAVYSGSLQLKGTAVDAYAFGSTVVAQVNGVSPGQGFFIRALPANGGATGAGAYGMVVNFAGGTMAPIAPPDTTVLAQLDLGGGMQSLSIGSSDQPGGKGKGLDVAREQVLNNVPEHALVRIGYLVGYGEEFTIGMQPGSRMLRARPGAQGGGQGFRVLARRAGGVIGYVPMDAAGLASSQTPLRPFLGAATPRGPIGHLARLRR